MSSFWSPTESWGEVLRDVGRFVTFRSNQELCDRFSWKHFAVGLVLTWMVGIARNWDLATAPVWASLGLASVAYIFFMAAGIWVFTRFIAFPSIPYMKVLTMVSLTAAPGLIYGIPVEMFMAPQDARSTNVVFLFLVASYRVALALQYLCLAGRLNLIQSFFTLGSPISAIVVGLHMTGRVQMVFDLMGGNRGRESVPMEEETVILNTLCCYAPPIGVMFLVVFLFLANAASLKYHRSQAAERLAAMQAQPPEESGPPEA